MPPLFAARPGADSDAAPASTSVRSAQAEQILSAYHAAHPSLHAPGPTNWRALLAAVRPPPPADASARATILQLLSCGDGVHTSVLSLALAEDKPDYVALVLALGAPPDGAPSALLTPLEAHALRPRASAAGARALLNRGARATPKALAAAAATANEALVHALLAAGADAAARRPTGRSALHALAGGACAPAAADEPVRLRLAAALVRAGACARAREVPPWVAAAPAVARVYRGGWRAWQIADGNRLPALRDWLRRSAEEADVAEEEGRAIAEIEVAL